MSLSSNIHINQKEQSLQLYHPHHYILYLTTVLATAVGISGLMQIQLQYQEYNHS
jgi:hypothetical protein